MMPSCKHPVINFNRHKLCVQRGWEKFGEEQPLSIESSTIITRPASPSKVPPLPTFHFTEQERLLNPKTCRWKSIYIRAFYLRQNWRCGRYTIAPILRGHKEPVNAIDCDGEIITIKVCIYLTLIHQM
jgi:F-box/WD-40 domain protein 7